MSSVLAAFIGLFLGYAIGVVRPSLHRELIDRGRRFIKGMQRG